MATQSKSVSYKDVQIAYLIDGMEAVKELYCKGRCSKPSLRRAFRELVKQGEAAGDFAEWMTKTIGPMGRGRAAPKVGETRSYKAQQIKNGGPFLRLPLDSLGISKGRAVQVRFEEDTIVVTR